MEQYCIKIENVRKVKEMFFNLKIESGVKLFIGDNASGKSTLLTCIGALIGGNGNSLKSNFRGDYNEAKITYKRNFRGDCNEDEMRYKSNDGSKICIWIKKGNWKIDTKNKMPKIKGFFESSILSGVRFEHLDYKNKTELKHDPEFANINKSAKNKHDFIIENLEYIINDNTNYKQGYFSNLKYTVVLKDENIQSQQNDSQKANNKKKKNADKKNTDLVYYINNGDNKITEFDFSTGEYFLLSILKIISGFRRTSKNCKLIVIDEFELGLSPLAQQRFLERLEIFAKKYNILFILATHSLVAINHIESDNIYYFENQSFLNPICSEYLQSKLYYFNSYDYIILVEDKLAKEFVQNIYKEIQDYTYKEVNILSIGGFGQIKRILEECDEGDSFFGKAKIIPIFDGDQRGKHDMINERTILYLPIDDVEKELVKQLIKDEMFYNAIDGNHPENLKTHKLNYNDEEKTIKESCDEYRKLSREKEKAKESKEIAKRIFGAIVSYVNDKRLNTEDITPQQYIIKTIISKLQEDELFKQFKQDLSNELKKGKK